MHKIIEIKDRSAWNNFIINSNFKFYSFLQSWEWGELQLLSGKEVVRLGIYKKIDVKDILSKKSSPKKLSKDKNTNHISIANAEWNLIGVMQIIKVKAKRASYLFIPHGPLIKHENGDPKKVNESNDYFEILKNILPELKALAKTEKFDFIRFNSTRENTLENEAAFRKLGFINAPMHEHAEDTHLLDLTPSIDELFNNIKKSDRYYINRAIKEGVEVVIGNSPEQIDILYKMHYSHSLKVGYHPFSKEFIENLYKVFGKNITTVSTRYNGITESILMTIRFGKTCVYYIAASDIKNYKFSPNYLCQWEAIKKAKLDGATLYNFWGVSPDNNPKHPIAGVSKFKRKFAGYDYSLLHAQDLIISPRYRMNYTIESMRRIKRGYYYKKPH